MIEFAAKIKELTDHEKLIFQSEIQKRSKSIFLGQMIALLFGGIGAHRFYLGQPWLGLIYFFGIPSVFAFVMKSNSIPLGALSIIFITLGLLVEVLMMRG